MFGISPVELLVIGAIGLLFLAPAVVVVAILVNKGQRSSNARSNPNLAPCPDCGRLVSRQAVSCPQCGRPLGGVA